MFVLLTEVKPCWEELLLIWVGVLTSFFFFVFVFFCLCSYFRCHSCTLKIQHQIYYFPLKTRVAEGEDQCIPQ